MLPQEKKPSYFFNYLVVPLFYIAILQAQVTPEKGNNSTAEQLYNAAQKIRFQNPDSSLVLFEKAHKGFLNSGDTLRAVKALLEMPYHNGQRVAYDKSYDNLWHALFLADDIKDEKLKAQIYQHLGRLYSYFKRKDEAFKYLEAALKINKSLVKKGLLNKALLTHDYYLMCATYRELGEPELGKIYLDSCFMTYDKTAIPNDLRYLQFEKAFILSKEKKGDKALQLLQTVEPWFQENRPSYLVLVYAQWGDTYRDLSDLQKSEEYYKKALEISDRYNSHLDFSILVHEKLADIYVKKGDYKKAFASQHIAKELDAQFFDSRSSINRPLLEIKDEFRLEREKQEKIVQKQRLEQLEQEEKISFLQRIILLGSLLFLILIGSIYFRFIRSKHRAEKQLIRRNKELEIQKAKELLELKNKELATFALQLVEKDEFLRNMKQKLQALKGNVETSEIKKVLKSISISNANNWEEFKLRFTAVNEKFYNTVTSKYPNLSQSDQRICALIKLNFSSKEMARLLGISVESVHTTRYRLRKKMGLDRSVNLEDFIAEL
ncbi:DNA-binding transcriptional regulator, CsgD family [Pricia antarctica]|uniref:DNA-binding transcriptional regulator, CsgD family n=1 Tax=Pricia antarctica TaxID=641691 RepID=A0A1G7CUH1_9FLAO|nr:tetratricopeptide repeat protein [Pricia antarctica]SDE42165.1 DNA-binding transcriptional regulator, CsgD family [Pricia antarctica]